MSVHSPFLRFQVINLDFKLYFVNGSEIVWPPLIFVVDLLDGPNILMLYDPNTLRH